jgi:GNAT superfamily N-acetyltransferase
MRAKYYRVSRLVVLPDFQGIGVGKRFLNFIAELYASQTKLPFYILTSNPQIIRGVMKDWKINRFGHASMGRGNTRINNEIRSSLSRRRITVSLQYNFGCSNIEELKSGFAETLEIERKKW